ncbi:MAG: carbon-nitrogen hydrolase family protein [Phototrophicaceae bacterium]
MSSVTVAIIQAEPVYYDLPQTVEKAIALIHDAVAKGAELVTFGETFFPGYPVWIDICEGMGLWDKASTKEVWAQLYKNSPTAQGAEVQALSKLAAQLNIVLVLPINERVGQGAGQGTLYNSILTIDSTGTLVNHHRKLVPTYTERIIWGAGDGAGVQAVDTSLGRVGGLVCWEHWMPMARQAMHDSGEQIHIAAWPTVKDILQVASRHYAHEGRTFVLAAGSVLQAKHLPSQLTLPDNIQPDDYVQQGGSAIIAPDGSYIVEPIYNEEVILTAELDLDMIIRESMALDVTGHYSRSDVFKLSVNRKRD